MRRPAFIKAGKKINILLREKYSGCDFFYIIKLYIISVRAHALCQYILACFRASAWIARNQPCPVFSFNNLTPVIIYHIIIL